MESDLFLDHAVIASNRPSVRALAVTEDGEIVIGTANGELCEISADGALSLLTQVIIPSCWAGLRRHCFFL